MMSGCFLGHEPIEVVDQHRHTLLRVATRSTFGRAIRRLGCAQVCSCVEQLFVFHDVVIPRDCDKTCPQVSLIPSQIS